MPNSGRAYLTSWGFEERQIGNEYDESTGELLEAARNQLDGTLEEES
jgi:hypothetical protein